MFKIFKKDRDHKPLTSAEQTKTATAKGWFARLSSGLGKTRHRFTSGLVALFAQSNQLDEATLDELEAILLSADLGVTTTQQILTKLTEQAKIRKTANDSNDSDALLASLQHIMLELLQPCAKPLMIPAQNSPYVVLMVGINGAGKTTTIGKLAKQLQQQGKSVMLAAGDTFRAAAIEQLQAWGKKNAIPVVAQHNGADSASVIYDALQSAQAKQVDVLIADTAGRLHTQQGLMAELAKVKRVIQKLDPNAPHETMLVLDASIGQNALQQAKEFNQAIGVSGITMTKLDGTAKGGILFAIAQACQIPVRYIGVGEGIEDLQTFKAQDFINALFMKEDNSHNAI